MTQSPPPESLTQPPVLQQAKLPSWKLWLQGLLALAALYAFIVAINLMGHGLKTIAKVPAGKEFMHQMFGYAAHPLAGLCVGVLITSLVQSSSFTTSFTVGLVVAGQISIPTAVPIIMGANIGTSVTNTLVSLTHLRGRLGFRRSLRGAVVHDFFNVLNVMLLLPLEVAFGVVSKPAHWLADGLEHSAFFTTNPKKFNFVKASVKPVTKACDKGLMEWMHLTKTAAGGIEAIIAVAILFAALVFLVRMLQGLLKERLSGLFSRTLFRNQGVSFFVGLLITVAVQSSSVTTSLVVPLVGAGVLTLRQIFPYTLGANIGTTVTAMLAALAGAALATGKGDAAHLLAASGLTVAFAHLLFNIMGTAVFWPLSWIPISLAKGFAKMAARRRFLAGVYIVVVFFVIPTAVILLTNL